MNIAVFYTNTGCLTTFSLLNYSVTGSGIALEKVCFELDFMHYQGTVLRNAVSRVRVTTLKMFF